MGSPEQPPAPAADSVDRIVAAWAREDPELGVRPVGVIARMARLRTRFDEELAGLFARYDLTAPDFAVIAALRRAGAPYRLRQSVLMERLGLTSGTVSLRLTRLVAKDVVTRRPDPDSARGALITLTPRGLRLFDQVGPAHLRNEDVLLSALTDDEQDQLTGLLRKLLAGFEHERSTTPLGCTVAPAHLARAMRVAVGLSDTPGLLITDVEPAGPADVAGLAVGDLLVTLDGAPLRSWLTLAGPTDPGRRLELGVLRGNDAVSVLVTTGPAAAAARGR